jgi:hypothetical protein
MCLLCSREIGRAAWGLNVPYASLCVVQWSYSITPGLGMSVALPIMGQPLGPGGSGRVLPFFRSRLWIAYAIRKPRAPRASVVVSPIVPVSFALAWGRGSDEGNSNSTVFSAVVYVYCVKQAGVGAIRRLAK